MAQAPHDNGGLHVDMPVRPQFPQGPARPVAPPAGISTPPTPFSEGESMGSPRSNERRPLRHSMTSHYRSLLEEPKDGSGWDKPPIPSALPLTANDESTPLPKIPMVVLSIVSHDNSPRS